MSKMLGGIIVHEGLCGLSITNDKEFCFLWVEFQFHTIPHTTPVKALSELRKTGIKGHQQTDGG